MTVTAITQPVVVGITIQMSAKDAQNLAKVLSKASEAMWAIHKCSQNDLHQECIDRGMIDDVVGSIENALKNAEEKRP